MGSYPFVATIGNIPSPLPVANGGTGAITAAAGLANLGGLVKQASTAVGGVALINGTQTILTWTTPNDGQKHRVMLFVGMVVTSALTGGGCQFQTTLSATLGFATVVTGGTGTGSFPNGTAGTVAAPTMADPNTAVTLAQTSAATAGAAIVWAEIWGS